MVIQESMVKGTKRALKAVIKERTFTDDALYTIMTEVESTVNSQPLTNVSDNIDDYEALMLNHFLLGRRSNNTPVINNKEVDVTVNVNGKQSRQQPTFCGHDGLANICQC